MNNSEKKYYLKKGEELAGPFSPDELASQGLRPEDRIFTTGWTEFRDAKDIPELADTLKRSKITGASESEMLGKLLQRLDSLEEQNKQLLREVSSLKEEADRQPEAPDYTPPPVPHSSALSSEQLDLWDKYMNSEKGKATEELPPYNLIKDTAPPKKRKNSDSGYWPYLIIAIGIFIIIISLYFGSR